MRDGAELLHPTQPLIVYKHIIRVVAGNYGQGKVNSLETEEKPPTYKDLVTMLERISRVSRSLCRRRFSFHNFHIKATLSDLMYPLFTDGLAPSFWFSHFFVPLISYRIRQALRTHSDVRKLSMTGNRCLCSRLWLIQNARYRLSIQS
jgi:hypothetical protein